VFKFDLLENEKILNVYRQTEAVLFRPVITAFLLISLPWYFLLKYDLASNYIRLLFFWTILVLLYAGHKFLLWMLNVYLLTNRRLIKVHYQNLLNKKVTESPLDKILNISYIIRGFLASVFHFGDVEVQVAGLAEPLILRHLSHPEQVKDFLWKTHNQFGHSHKMGTTEIINLSRPRPSGSSPLRP